MVYIKPFTREGMTAHGQGPDEKENRTVDCTGTDVYRFCTDPVLAGLPYGRFSDGGNRRIPVLQPGTVHRRGDKIKSALKR